jgi:hypothetical protein
MQVYKQNFQDSHPPNDDGAPNACLHVQEPTLYNTEQLK